MTMVELDRMWAAVTIVTVVLSSAISAIEQATLARYAPDQSARTL